MNAVGAVRRLLARQTSYRRVGSAHSNNGNGNGSGTGRRRRLSDPPTHESEEEDDGDPYVEDGDVAHGPFVYASFVMLGIAMLLPWFSFTTAAAFFREVFVSRPAIAKSCASSIAAASTVPNLLIMFLLARERTEKNINRRIVFGLSINLALFALFAILTFAVAHPSPIPYYIFTIISVIVGSSATAVIQYASFGLAGRFGPLYTQAIMTGQGLSGIAPPITSLVTAATASSPEIAAGIFFACSGLLTGITLIIFLFLARITPKESAAGIPADATVELLNERTTIDKPIDLLRRMGPFPWAVAGVFIVTLAVFPSLTSAIVSVHTGEDNLPPILTPALFIPLHFLVMNTSDFIGRATPGISTRYLTIQNPGILVTLTCVRIVFWPLFWACNVSDHGPRIALFGDIAFFLILVLFGLSNGWVATCLMMEGGMYVPVHEREKANSLMSFCLCIGLALGSLLSFVVSSPFIQAD